MSDDKKNLYNPHEGLTGRDGGPYLDQEERRLAEIRRAAVEDREPDFEKAAAGAGTPLVTAGQLVTMANPTSVPSQEQADPYALAVDKFAKDESFPVNAFTERDVLETEAQATAAEDDTASAPFNNPASPVYVSHDPDEELDEDADDDDILDALTTPDEDDK